MTEAEGNVPAGFRSVEVETGLISENYVEIQNGLSEGMSSTSIRPLQQTVQS